MLSNQRKNQIIKELKATWKDKSATPKERQAVFGHLLYFLVGSKSENSTVSNQSKHVSESYSPSRSSNWQQTESQEPRYMTVRPSESLPPPMKTRNECLMMEHRERPPLVSVLNYSRELSVEQVTPYEIGEDDMDIKYRSQAPDSSLSQIENGILNQNGSSMHQSMSQKESFGTIRGKGGDDQLSQVSKSQKRKKNKQKFSDEHAIALARDFLQINDYIAN